MDAHGILYIGIGTVASGPALVDLGKRIELQISKLFDLKDVLLSVCYTQIAQGEKRPLVMVYHLEKTALERIPNLNDLESQITELLETETSPNLAVEVRLYEQTQIYQPNEARDPQIEGKHLRRARPICRANLVRNLKWGNPRTLRHLCSNRTSCWNRLRFRQLVSAGTPWTRLRGRWFHPN